MQKYKHNRLLEDGGRYSEGDAASFACFRTLHAGSRVQTASIPLSVRFHVVVVERRCGRSENVNQTTRENRSYMTQAIQEHPSSLTRRNIDRRFADSAVQNFFLFVLLQNIRYLLNTRSRFSPNISYDEFV